MQVVKVFAINKYYTSSGFVEIIPKEGQTLCPGMIATFEVESKTGLNYLGNWLPPGTRLPGVVVGRRFNALVIDPNSDKIVGPKGARIFI